jgi:hypothetical protein
MMPGAPFPPPQSSASVLLWHPRAGATCAVAVKASRGA